MVIDGIAENLVEEIKNMRVGFLQLILLEKIYKEEADKGHKKSNTIDGGETIKHDKMECFQNKKRFYYELGNGMLL